MKPQLAKRDNEDEYFPAGPHIPWANTTPGQFFLLLSESDGLNNKPCPSTVKADTEKGPVPE